MRRVAGVGVLVVAYGIAFATLEPRIGDAVLSLSVIPIVTGAWLLGLRGGLMTGLAIVALNITLMQTLGQRDGFRPSQVPRIFVAVALGVAAGYARDLARRQRELLDENVRVKQNLERLVAERTTELVTTNRELTEQLAHRSELEARAASADRMAQIGTLTAGIGHEINNPLAAVIANLEVLAQRMPTDPLAGDAIRDAQEAARRVAAIARDLKLFTQPVRSGSVGADVRHVVESTVRMVANEIRQRARLEIDLTDTRPVLVATHELGQVVLNLLVNAFQALPETGGPHTVTLKVRPSDDGESIRITVSDTGAGIAPEHVARVFDPFFTTKPIGVGTGLGLWVCHQIVTSARGRIVVDSTPGRGTTFVVELPAGDPLQAQVAETVPLPVVKKARILVVDDDPIVGRSVEKLVRDRHEVIYVEDATSALARLEAGERFDVILSDVMMPDLDGVQLHERVRALAPDQGERMVFMTGGAFTAHATKFMDEPGRKRLDKPFTRADLEAALALVLGEATAPSAASGVARSG